ncbi:MAG: permease-like cell division protein FtsX [bacterium]|nr:permease-like cell division protein FtsX [bacterium]
MRFFATVLLHTGRNLLLTWKSQLMSFFTVMLSVLIFAFFYLTYANAVHVGTEMGNDLRLVVYLDEDPPPSLQDEYRRRILKFDQVERIEFVGSKEAFDRFSKQLGSDSDVLSGVPDDFLPPSIEVYPQRSLDSLARIKRFSDYLETLPGVLKVQYGKEWIDHFHAFIQLMRIVITLSGFLLVITSTFMVAYTIRLSLFSRRKELELLRLVGATTNYIRMPFLLEGALMGLCGSAAGLFALYLLYHWIKLQFAGPALFNLVPFTFLSWPVIIAIVVAATLLCAIGSFRSTRSIQHL